MRNRVVSRTVLVCFGLILIPSTSAGELDSVDDAGHPLHRLRDYATKKHDFVKEHVRDYTCQIVKRERIDGKLQQHQFMLAKVRSGHSDDNGTKPFAVHLKYQAPGRVAGRDVQYVAGENDGGMLVRLRRGGVTLRIDLDNPVAMRESSVPITHLGFEAVLQSVIKALNEEIEADPTGKNTQVKILKGVKINGRPSTVARIIHAKKRENSRFNIASMFIDNKWQMPTRFEIYDWPVEEGGDAVLRAEFTYVNLKVNVGLPDAAFEVLQLPKKPADAEATARSKDGKEVQ